jgi:hypothetical protein
MVRRRPIRTAPRRPGVTRRLDPSEGHVAAQLGVAGAKIVRGVATDERNSACQRFGAIFATL